jgi:hypothetical protein
MKNDKRRNESDAAIEYMLNSRLKIFNLLALYVFYIFLDIAYNSFKTLSGEAAPHYSGALIGNSFIPSPLDIIFYLLYNINVYYKTRGLYVA